MAGRICLYQTYTPNTLFLNRHNGTFKEFRNREGVAFTENGAAISAWE